MGNRFTDGFWSMFGDVKLDGYSVSNTGELLEKGVEKAGKVAGGSARAVYNFPKFAGKAAIAAVGVGALAYVASSFRKPKAYDPDKIPDMPELPPVVNFAPLPAPETLMGQTPTPGAMAEKVGPRPASMIERAASKPEPGAPVALPA